MTIILYFLRTFIDFTYIRHFLFVQAFLEIVPISQKKKLSIEFKNRLLKSFFYPFYIS